MRPSKLRGVSSFAIAMFLLPSIGTAQINGITGDGVPSAAGTSEGHLPQGIVESLQESLERDAYMIRPTTREAGADSDDLLYVAANPLHAMGVTFSGAGLEVSPTASGERPWRWAIELTGYGRGGSLLPVTIAKRVAQESRIEYRRGSIVEWYINNPRGVEQGFTVLSMPERGANTSAPLHLELSVSGGLVPALKDEDQGIEFHTLCGRRVLTYDHLFVFDAEGRELSSRFELLPSNLERSTPSHSGIRIVIDDTDAVYPVTVDPLIATETKKLIASGAGSFDRTGQTAAIDGDTAAIGSPIHNNFGSVYLFDRNEGGPEN